LYASDTISSTPKSAMAAARVAASRARRPGAAGAPGAASDRRRGSLATLARVSACSDVFVGSSKRLIVAGGLGLSAVALFGGAAAPAAGILQKGESNTTCE
jgi:hypothetical protein